MKEFGLEVEKGFPNVLKKDRIRFVEWALQSLNREYSLEKKFLPIEFINDDFEKENLINSENKFVTSKSLTSFRKGGDYGINIAGYLHISYFQ